jgi:hypothetical protein
MWPIDPVKNDWTEDQVFDMFQFLGEIVSKPMSGWHHHEADCGLHPEEFDQESAKREYVLLVNRGLRRYSIGWEMRADLSIVELPPVGLGQLVRAKIPNAIDADSRDRITSAIEKYQRRGASRSDRKDAVRDLGDVLELYRNETKSILGKTEGDLFNVLNNFGIRHHNANQKVDYDAIFLAAQFYHFLNMIHVLAHILKRQQNGSSKAPGADAHLA